MPKSTFAGHPLHPMLIVAPAALIPFGFVMDAMYRRSGDESYADAAYYSLVGGLVGGVAAATSGLMDYLTISPETEVKRTANVHASLNGAAMALTLLNVFQRRADRRAGSLMLSAAAAAGVLVSGWFGGRMVYDQGMRVSGVDPTAGAPELAPPADELLETAMLREEKLAPSAGPVLH
ncbi:DUF2231 domain-containing protein [Noviherbaspirillum aridicola]|uniref:DUF2231 domain-containing protein n=1 Tax=Noviherbaspirillum aridicola TaxID=2849687 RepID=A0ABQ4Q016_9BURK|nr:DUF2231 domain-containing protein [Noviherbaspirillum aridicola]GIZ50411.1 hypothetical protein NCCP691_04250 [Noviherbaspirillum aridicola]